MDIEKAAYDNSKTLVLQGKAGLFEGEFVVLNIGQCITVGRSRRCSMSVARAARCVAMDKAVLESHSSYRKISREHFRVCYLNATTVEIEDLSTNGTVVGEHKIDRLQIADLKKHLETQQVQIHIGEGEVFELSVPDPSQSIVDSQSRSLKTEQGSPPPTVMERRPTDSFRQTPVP